MLILAALPLIALAALLRLDGRKPLFVKTRRVGRWCEPFDEYSFSELPRFLLRIPALFNIVKGDMSFVGPRAVSPGELNARQRQARKRYSARPGLICLWWIRKRANIAYLGEVESDSEYVESQTLQGDLGIALRAIPALLYGEGIAATQDVVSILGIRVHNLTMADVLDWILRRIESQLPSQICFYNADCANIMHHDPEYCSVLNQADLVLADGIGLRLAGRLLGSEIRQNVNGTDLFPRLCEMLSGTGVSLFLLGARPGIAEKVRDWIGEHYPGVQVGGCRNGYFTVEDEPEILDQIARSGAAILLVALGAPLQDKWIRRHLNATGIKIAIGVGGLFDFYSGRIPRAPVSVREIGAEWLYRLYQEPQRMWKRYLLGNAIFLWRVVRSQRASTKSEA